MTISDGVKFLGAAAMGVAAVRVIHEVISSQNNPNYEVLYPYAVVVFFGFSLVIGGLIYDYLTVEVTSDNLTNSVSIGHSAPITDDTLESDDDEDELSDEEEAELISLKTWRIERIHSSCFHDDNGDLTWALLMIIMHDDDSYELTVTDWHDESTSYFLLKEGQEIRFEFSEQNLVNDYTDHEFITDYLKPILVAGKQDQ